MDGFKRIRSLILDNPSIRERHLEKITEKLEQANVPVSDDPCRTCANPCDMGHAEYPTRFDVDVTSDLLGSVKPYQRQIVISTGRTNWGHEVTEEDGSLAQHMYNAVKRNPSTSHKANSDTEKGSARVDTPGVFSSTDASRLSILNGSHHSTSRSDDRETVLVFPDYKVVRDVQRSSEGADLLWRTSLDPSVGRTGRADASDIKSWPLLYACVILLCSHKRRDKRCHIASLKLEAALMDSLESEGYEVHTQLDDALDGPPLEDMLGTDEEREAELTRRLQAIAEVPKRALILKNSHVGGHKYAGNVLIYMPQGSGVWYGRVTTHEVPALVKTTICEGKVLPALLRGGVNLTRPTGEGLLSW